MRTKDVEVGQTYRCEVPFSLPVRRYRPTTMGDSWWPLSRLRGTHFPLAVVDVDAAARTALGLVMGAGTRITVELTEEQAEAAGLSPGHGYQVRGTLLDADGEPVELPQVTTLTVPIRWLRPVETPVSPSHHDPTFRGFH
ncbi:hypothetical protein [Streptomyces sp. NPDC091209]|uniref:hypothetical protein n=1 Tax=Streptomyces sp. NPDC091209 TaxID=3365974 RepID=UPI0038214DAA